MGLVHTSLTILLYVSLVRALEHVPDQAFAARVSKTTLAIPGYGCTGVRLMLPQSIDSYEVSISTGHHSGCTVRAHMHHHLAGALQSSSQVPHQVEWSLCMFEDHQHHKATNLNNKAAELGVLTLHNTCGQPLQADLVVSPRSHQHGRQLGEVESTAGTGRVADGTVLTCCCQERPLADGTRVCCCDTHLSCCRGHAFCHKYNCTVLLVVALLSSGMLLASCLSCLIFFRWRWMLEDISLPVRHRFVASDAKGSSADVHYSIEEQRHQECPVCLDEDVPDLQWVVFICGHATCRSCHYKLIHQNAEARICPICRTTIGVKDSLPKATPEIMPAMTPTDVEGNNRLQIESQPGFQNVLSAWQERVICDLNAHRQ